MKQSCGSKSFSGLMITQFMGAFSDNLLKVVVSLLALQMITSSEAATRFVSLVGFLFILPYVLFSPYAGHLADRFAKRNIIIIMSGLKVVLAGVATWVLAVGSLGLLCGIVFVFMVESAFFSPAKYGILPEMLNEEDLSRGNGYMQMWTFIGIITGTAAGGILYRVFDGRLYWIGIVMSVLLLGAFMASFAVTSDKKNAEIVREHFWVGALSALKGIREDKGLRLTMLALAFFSFLGAVFQMNILIYGAHVLGLAQDKVSYLLVAVSIGIAAGSVFAGYASERKVELGLVPLGAVGMAVLSFFLGFGGSFWRAGSLLFVLGICAGFYTVPLNAFFQRCSPSAKRGQYQSVLSIVTSFGSLLAGVFLWLAGGQWGLQADQVFILLAALTLLAGIYIVKVLPVALLRLVSWLLAHTIYRLKIVGADNVPSEGGALIAANHMSFVDAMLIVAALKRPVRFIMARSMYELPVVNFFCRIMNVIPIDPAAGSRDLVQSLRCAHEAVQKGEMVCIFPEGRLSRTGNMLPFKRGFEHIVKGLAVPVIPLYLDNIWGSIYTYAHGKYFFKWPRLSLYPVSIVIGRGMPASAKAHQVRQNVQELGAEANILRGAWRKKLHLAFVDEVKRHPFKRCMADSTGLEFTAPKVFAAAVSLAHCIFPKKRQDKQVQEMAGILLPSSCMAAVVNIAVAFTGRIPVNLNFTLSREALESCIQQCAVRTIITSRAFLTKTGLSPRPEMVYLEDMKAQIHPVLSALVFAAALVLPRWLLSALYIRGDKQNVHDVATVIFSSGSTGEPKGVQLTHANIFSNIEGLYQVFDIKPGDVVVAALPFFHSFGFTATMCFPLGTAVGVVYHTNPLDAGTIGKLAAKYQGTILMGTPTFLSAYVKKCTPEQFKTVRMAVVGAEKLKETLAAAFQEKFGITPFEGYGASELSPIVTVGFPDYVHPVKNEIQKGHKAGMVGHPIPGVAVKVVDPDTFTLKETDEEGLLLVKGANVMKGYLHNPVRTAEVLRDGWYITGDIARIDEDGFIKITDRLSRFSKVGGEMVPHIKVEENIMEVLGAVEPVIAVTAVPDEKKGERLVVLHALDIDVEAMCLALSRKGIPNLWIPKKDSFLRVESIPFLGTGKIDLKRVKALALENVMTKEEPDA